MMCRALITKLLGLAFAHTIFPITKTWLFSYIFVGLLPKQLGKHENPQTIIK